MKRQIRPRATAIAQKFPTSTFSPGNPGETTGLSAAERYAVSRRGLWHLLIFLLVSVAAFSVQDFRLFAAVSEKLWPLLGAPPPESLLHLGLAIYLCSALILLPSRLNKAVPAQGWAQVGYRTSFYLFYLVSNALAANFIIVFAAGLLLFVAEQAYLWIRLPKLQHEDTGR